MATPAGHVPNLGVHIANRLVEVGCTTAFAVPGDFNLLLLDQLLKHPQLELVWCCNELNAGYAADGYARKKGIGCVVVTFSVGGFSALNAIAGAMSEDLPVIVISGCPNSNDYGQNRVLHHTVGLPDFDQQLRAFKEVTCCQVTINHLEDAARQVDTAISAALAQKKPAYIEVSCNLADLTHPSFALPPVPYSLPSSHTNKTSLAAAVDVAAKVLSTAVRPVLLAGSRLRHGELRHHCLRLCERARYPFAVLAGAKGLLPEDHPQCLGLYWGPASWPGVSEAVDEADVVLVVGALWTDVTTVGFASAPSPHKSILVLDSSVTVCGGPSFGCIAPEHFLLLLADRLTASSKRAAASKAPQAVTAVQGTRGAAEPAGSGPLTTRLLYSQVQAMLTPDMAVFADTGDAWFHTHKLRLPAGAEYEAQMLFASVGWSVGAVLGYGCACRDMAASKAAPHALDVGVAQGEEDNASPALDLAVTVQPASGGPKRAVAFIGDGCFQMTAQEVSTMLRYGLNPIIFLINNGGYTMLVKLHDGPYNVLQNWDYTAIVGAMQNQDGKLWTAKVRTEDELATAIAAATSSEHQQDLCFIEVFTAREDSSDEVQPWGAQVAKFTARKPPRDIPPCLW